MGGADAGGILGAIGNTPLVALTRIAPARGARVVVKLESANPTGTDVYRS